MWRAWAWHVRGGGYASSVKPEAWELFTSKIANASAALDRCKHLFEEARRKYPWFVPLYLWAANYLSPQWGGSYEAVEAFARQTVDMPFGADYSLYARIYWHVTSTEELEFDVFHDSQARWDLMKKGFEALMSRYPNSMWNLNAFASFACRAQDRETYGRLRAKIGRHLFVDAWPSNAPMEVCDQQLLGHS